MRSIIFELLLFSLLVRPVLCGRRGIPEALPTSSLSKEGLKWSGTGVQGLDHSPKSPIGKNKMVERVIRVHHHNRHMLENHPYASGVFTLDPKEDEEN